MNSLKRTGTSIGIGYRPELALFVERYEGLGFVEIMAEDFHSPACISQNLKNLANRGVAIIIHCTSLSLGGAEPIDLKMVKHLDELARYFGAPFVSDHVAFVRAGGLESGHLLPVARNSTMLDILERNVSAAKELLSVPLVLENIATTFEWPQEMQEMDEAVFMTELLKRTDCQFLLDISNLFANSFNHKFDPVDYLKRLPLERLAYVHLAGGTFKQGLYHDTHCHPLKEQSLTLLASLCEIMQPPRVMLERDDSFPPKDELISEIESIAAVCKASEVTARDIAVAKYVTTPQEQKLLLDKASMQTKHPMQETASFGDIASLQESLMQTLIINADAPESVATGIDSELLRQAHESLIRKRLRTMQRACPYLTKLFGDDKAGESALQEALRDFYRVSPSPSPQGPYVDAMQFVLYLSKRPLRYQAASRLTTDDLNAANAVVSGKTASISIRDRIGALTTTWLGLLKR